MLENIETFKANLIVSLIPAACPFERDITIFGKIYHIPALCRYNPMYYQLMELRFKSLCYLAERN